MQSGRSHQMNLYTDIAELNGSTELPPGVPLHGWVERVVRVGKEALENPSEFIGSAYLLVVAAQAENEL